LDLELGGGECVDISVVSMAAKNTMLYIDAEITGGCEPPNGIIAYPGLHMVDISNPLAPQKKHYLGTRCFPGMLAWKDYLLSGGGRLNVDYIDNGIEPILMASYAISGSSRRCVTSDGLVTMVGAKGVYLLSLQHCDQLKVPPQADFSWDPAPVTTGRPVKYFDRSTGIRTDWLWDFGDGSTSEEQNPKHLYWKSGSYDVVLTAVNPFGTSTITRRVDVAADTAPLPSLPWIYLLPAAADTWSATGGRWKTRLRLEYLLSGSAAAGIEFLEADRTNAPAVPLPLYIEGGEATDNLVAATGRAGAHGAFLISLESDAFYLQAEMLNDRGGSGTVGESLPLISVEDLFQAGEKGVLIGLREDDTRHTNIGMVNLHEGPVTFYAQYFDPDGRLLGADNYTVPGRSVHQEDFVLRRITGGEVKEAYAIFTPIVGAGRFYVYGSVVDHGSGDFTFLQPHWLGSDSAAPVFVPAAAHCDGDKGARWTTDVVLHNPTTEPLQARLAFLPSGMDNRDAAERDLQVGPGAVVRLEDIMGDFFQSPGQFGGVRIAAPSNLMVQSRTYNTTSGGIVGQAVPAVRYESAAHTGAYRPIYAGALDPQTRLNIGFLNLTEQRPFVDAILTEQCNWDADYVGYVEHLMEPFGHYQMNDIGTQILDWSALQVCVWALDSPDVFTYVSVVDSASGDAVFFPAMP